MQIINRNGCPITGLSRIYRVNAQESLILQAYQLHCMRSSGHTHRITAADGGYFSAIGGNVDGGILRYNPTQLYVGVAAYQNRPAAGGVRTDRRQADTVEARLQNRSSGGKRICRRAGGCCDHDTVCPEGLHIDTVQTHRKGRSCATGPFDSTISLRAYIRTRRVPSARSTSTESIFAPP